MTHPERIVPDETETGVVALHLKRYDFARQFCADADVLDAACGVGYGTAYLADVARSAVGVDVSADAVAYATKRYGGPRTSFREMDVAALAFEDDTFDVVCSFETLEHVRDPRAAVREAARVLRPSGVYVASTPHVERTCASPENPFHETEYSPEDFSSLLHEASIVVRTSAVSPGARAPGTSCSATTKPSATRMADILPTGGPAVNARLGSRRDPARDRR